MVILALDTSGLELVVTLVNEGGPVSGRAVPGPRHQDQVIELITDVGGDHLASIDAVAVTRGPGSHTGLRVGLSTASGIAFARRLPIYPLSSLAVAARRAPRQASRVLALVAAGRGRAYAQPFERTSDDYRAVGERRLEPLEAVATDDAVLAAEPALLAQLGAMPGGHSGVDALAAAVKNAVGEMQPVNYDQLRGDYGEF